MDFIKGRDNLSVTVYVPYNCTNNCEFCTSKEEYNKGVNFEKIKEQLRKVRRSSINEVVFTGGEPMSDCKKLFELIEIVNNKDVYINTSLISQDICEFVETVNNTSCIKGLNISRHTASYETDKAILNNIVEDLMLGFIKKPIKINVVFSKDVSSDFLRGVLNRWAKIKANIKISFRANFNDTKPENLHSLTDQTLMKLINVGTYVGRGSCDVCDTTDMEYSTNGKELRYSYHRGLASTSNNFITAFQVNDIIIFPDGDIAYDWNRDNYAIESMLEQFDFNGVKTTACAKRAPITPKETTTNVAPSNYRGCGSGYGFGRCGM